MAAEGDYLDSFGPDGTAATEFDRPAALAVDPGTGAVYVADSETQVLYKFDADGNPLNYGGTAPYISGNEITGLELHEGVVGTAEVAVDPDTHVVYVTSGNKVVAFDENGERHEFTEGPGAFTNEIPGATTEMYGVAVDAFGNIYASDVSAEKVRIYTSTGALITEFHTSLPEGSTVRPGPLAVAPDGTLYVANDGFPVVAFEPSIFPVTSETTYGVGESLNESASSSASVTVDPTTEYVYIGERCPPSAGCVTRISVYDEENSLVGVMGVAELNEESEGYFPAGLGVQDEKLYASIRGGGAIASQVAVFEAFEPPVLKPSIASVFATDVTSTTATLHGRINPNTVETTYHFEWGNTDCSVKPAACTSVPLSGESIGSGHKAVLVSADLSGLTPDTVYYYRIVATNAVDTTEGPVRTIRTQGSAFGFEAIDGRVWEQVTPIDKHGGAIFARGVLMQAAANGSGIAFATKGSIFGAPDGNRAAEPAAVLSRRDGGGNWVGGDLVPPQAEAIGVNLGAEYKAFSTDLTRAMLEPRGDSPLSSEASERTPYLRVNTVPPLYRPLVTGKEGYANVEPGTVFSGGPRAARYPVSIEGANDALTDIVVSSEVPLVAGAAEKAIYMWHDGALEPISELPADGGGIVKAELGSGSVSIRHAVSDDGSRVFWVPGEFVDHGGNALFLRDTSADETVRIDVPRPGGDEAGEANVFFMGASVDGSVVFFTDSQRLTADAHSEGRDLYRCKIGDVGGSLGCSELEDLSATIEGVSIKVQEVALGMSDDGDTVYFVANADAAAPRLYVWQEGQGLHFVASLSAGDHLDWAANATGSATGAHSAFAVATSSSSGRYLAFMSERNLTDRETADPESGDPVEQVYVYDAVADTLACASCNPSGATDSGYRGTLGAEGTERFLGGTLPQASEFENLGHSMYHPRAMLDNGRVIFNSPLPLVPSDSNGTWDVYQYEPFGVGGCTAASRRPSIGVADGACVGLISAGTGQGPSTFMDASANGDDIFFATTDPLSALDSDSITDVYDARVGGVAAVAERHPECLGEACQPPPSPPNDATPASAAYSGPGDPKPKVKKHCRRGQRKVRRNGKVRCVKRHHRNKATKGGHR
ncbi:MAG: hypothetical protein ACTHNY_01190 [Solirubrobacterales bacterium]